MRVKVKKKRPASIGNLALKEVCQCPKGNPDCQECDLHMEAQTVCLMGHGPVPCDYMIIGEAPGYKEDEDGKPFVGKTGKELERLLKIAGMNRNQFYITNAVKCRPPENNTPSQKEIKACSHYLKMEIEKVKPKYILVLGAVAMKATLNKSGITKRQGEVIEKDGIKYFLTLHPAALFRQPQKTAQVEADFKRFRLLVDGKLKNLNNLNWTLVNSPAQLKMCLDSIKKAEVVAYDIETSGLNPVKPDFKIFGIGLAQKGKQWYIPLWYPGSNFSDFEMQKKVIMSIRRVLGEVSPKYPYYCPNGSKGLIKSSTGKILVPHGGKFDNKCLKFMYGWDVPMGFDTLPAAYLLDENSFIGLKPLSKKYFNAPDYDIPKPINPDVEPLEKVAKYCCWDVYYTLGLYPIMKEGLEEDEALNRIFWNLSLPSSKAFEDIELEGNYLDPDKYREALVIQDGRVKEALAKLNARIPRKIVKIGGKKISKPYKNINWNSFQQIGDLFYNKMGMEVLKVTESKKPSTDESTLLQLKEGNPIVVDLLKYREQKKLMEFLEQWRKGMVNDRIFPSFKLCDTVTGRLACEDPNLQQVPREKFLRSLITAPPGWVFFEADYSQIELRIAAMIANEKTMKQAYQTGQDLHQKTASAVSGIPYDQVTKDQRKKAKAVNFGFIYGMWWRKFKDYARDKYDVHLTDAEAKEFRETFFSLYPGLVTWHERVRRVVKKLKYVRNPIGRKRRLPDIDSPDKMLRGESERQGINSPVQSFGSDLAVYSIVRVCNELPEDKIRVCGNVHDAILGIVKVGYEKEMLTKVHKIMTNTSQMEKVFKFEMTVPIEAEFKLGPWGSGEVVNF